ncbi:MAG TPA: hypothetical protein VGN16_01825 [Acidobacteriaceae bacterium]|jgi:tetratricopeptide (TPR) repeat protein
MAQEPVISAKTTPRLESWKEIAAYLGRDDRTAKRWEKTRSLPVHRLPGVRSGVFAFPEEIERWQRSANADATAGDSDAEAIAFRVSATAAAALEFEESQFTRDPHSSTELAGFAPEKIAAPISNSKAWWTSLPVRVATLTLALAVLGGTAWFAYHATQQQDPQAPLSSTTSPRPAAHVPPRDAEDLYLSGRYFWNRRTPADLNTALRLFKNATERDPKYAAAYIGVADTEFLLVEYASLPPGEAYPAAIAAARRAIELDPSLPEAHRSLAFTAFYWNWDRKLAESEFRRAIELDPRNATTHHWFANVLMTSGRNQEALAEIDRARELDPTSIAILADRAHILAALNRTQEATDDLLKIEHSDPAFRPAHWYLGSIYHSTGDDQEYVRELKQLAQLSRREADIESYRAAERGWAKGGTPGMLQALAEIKTHLYDRGMVDAFDAASALAEAGRKREAIQYLKQAYLHRDTQFLTLSEGRVLLTLRSESEYWELARKSASPYDEHAKVARLVLPKV